MSSAYVTGVILNDKGACACQVYSLGWRLPCGNNARPGKLTCGPHDEHEDWARNVAALHAVRALNNEGWGH